MNLAEMLSYADDQAKNVDIDENTEFAPIEPGTYEVAVTNASGPHESKRTDPSNPSVHGQYIKIELTVVGPKHANRKLWMNNNVICVPKDSTDEARVKAQKGMAIGARERSVMLSSVRKIGISSAEELVGATFLADVIVRKADGDAQKKDDNQVKSIKPIGGNGSKPAKSPSSGVGSANTSPSQQQSQPRQKMPWDK